MDSRWIAHSLVLGTVAGVILGSLIGVVTGDLGFWIAIGVPLGASIGLSTGTTIGVLTQATPEHNCPFCDYDTTGLASSVCPECGNELPDDPA